jgi:hypothetical protein
MQQVSIQVPEAVMLRLIRAEVVLVIASLVLPGTVYEVLKRDFFSI